MEGQKLLSFHTVAEGARVHVLGRGMDGTVVEANTRRGRRAVLRVMFDDGREVSYTTKTFAATVALSPAPDRPKTKVSPRIRSEADLLRIVKPQPAVVPPRVIRQAPRRRPNQHAPRAKRAVRSREYSTPLPIPGPPVPKPERGVWEH